MATDAAQFGSTPTLIQVAAGTFTPPGGAPVAYAGTSLKHFLDGGLAAAHFAEANRLALDDAAIAALDGRSVVEQSEYFFKILSHLANGYNALCLAWYCDPVARGIYRQWIAGAPQGSAASQLAAQFAKDSLDYRQGWYSFRFPWPELPNRAQQQRDADAGNSPLTGLPLAARTQFERYNTPNVNSTVQWVQLCGLYIDAEDRDVTNPRELPDGVAYAPNVRNRAFVMVPGRPRPTVWTDGNEQDPFLRPEDEHVVNERWRHAVQFGGYGFEDLPMPPTGVFVNQNDGTRQEQPTWRTFAYDEQLSAVVVPLKASNALIEYLGWVRAWAAACVARQPTEIVVASRMYILWMNGQTQAQNGNVVQDIINRDAQLQADRDRGDPTATVVFRAMAAVAPAFAAGGPWGAAIGLGITAVSAIGQVVTALVGSPISARRKRDDLGFFKPMFQRAMISGSLLGDVPPVLQIPAPPGWHRPLVLSAFLLPGMVAAPPLEGSAILARLGLDAAGWRALTEAQRNERLGAIGFYDDAAKAAATQAVGWYLDPSSRPHADSARGGGSGTTVLLVVGAVAAGLLLLGRGKR